MSSEAPVVAVPAEEVKAAEPAVEAPAAAEPVAVSSTLLLRWHKSVSEFSSFVFLGGGPLDRLMYPLNDLTTRCIMM